MKATKSFVQKCLASVLALGAASSAWAVAVVTLPYPGEFVQGIPTNQIYDQGLVYSSRLLDQMQAAGQIPAAYGNYMFSTGTGNIPVLVYTGAGGATNNSPFQDPLAACGGGNCTSFDGVWGLGNSASQYAGTVGALRTALGGANMMFYFDHNEQEGANAVPNLRVTGQMSIYNGLSLVSSFAIDLNPNGSYDQNAWITSCSTAIVGLNAPNNLPCGIKIPTATATYTLDSNAGSGKPDFFVVFPQFDLYSGSYADNYKVVIEMHLRDLDPGFDELGIAGYRFAPRQDVPEPMILALLALALTAMGLVTRRRALMRRIKKD